MGVIDYPFIVGTALSNPGGTGTTLTLDFDATHNVYDILIGLVENTGNAAWSAPAGFTMLDQRSVGTATTGIVSSWLRRLVLPSDVLPIADPSCSLGATVTRLGTSWVVRNADPEGIFTLPEYNARGFATGTANPVRPPSVTTLVPNCLVLHGYGQRAATNAPDPVEYLQIAANQEGIISGTIVINGSQRNVNPYGTVLSSQDANPTSGARWGAGILCIPPRGFAYFRSGAQATTGSGTSVTPAIPTGTSASDWRGNKDVMIITVEGAGSTTLSMTDSAWKRIPEWDVTTPSTGSTIAKFWCYMTATPPSAQANRTGTGEISACITTYRNCDQVNPIGATAVQSNASSTSSSFPTLNRQINYSTVQATCVADGTPTFTSPATWTERMDGLGITCADKIFDPIGNVASAAFTLSAANASVCGLLEIRSVAEATNPVLPNNYQFASGSGSFSERIR